MAHRGRLRAGSVMVGTSLAALAALAACVGEGPDGVTTIIVLPDGAAPGEASFVGVDVEGGSPPAPPTAALPPIPDAGADAVLPRRCADQQLHSFCSSFDAPTAAAEGWLTEETTNGRAAILDVEGSGPPLPYSLSATTTPNTTGAQEIARVLLATGWEHPATSQGPYTARFDVRIGASDGNAVALFSTVLGNDAKGTDILGVYVVPTAEPDQLAVAFYEYVPDQPQPIAYTLAAGYRLYRNRFTTVTIDITGRSNVDPGTVRVTFAPSTDALPYAEQRLRSLRTTAQVVYTWIGLASTTYGASAAAVYDNVFLDWKP